MKKTLFNLATVLKYTFLELLIIFLILHTAIFNIIDIAPHLCRIDVNQIMNNFNSIINLIDNLLIPKCYAVEGAPSSDRAVSEALKGGNLTQAFQADLFTGKAGFTYHVDVPPGRKGIQPNLNLIYSSQSNNDWCGVGWNLDLGSIYRSTKRGIPKYDGSDTFIFSINGSESELVGIGSNEYRTKIESEFMRFYFNGTYWEITDKTGIKYRIGYDAGSRITNSRGIYKWCLDKVIDVFGNYMLVSYTQDQNQIYLSQIRYTGNENLGNSPNFIADFIIESRQDMPPNYRTGDRVVTAYRLKEIQTKIDANLAKKYILSYTYSNDSKRSLLASVTQYGSDGNTYFPPTTFVYKENGYNITPGNNWISGFNGIKIISGDFNGDGLVDAGVVNGNGESLVALSNGTQFSSPVNWGNAKVTFSGDFNGDGLGDLGGIKINRVEWGPGQLYIIIYYTWEVAISNGSNFVVNNWTGEYFRTSSGSDSRWACITGDFNGDGLTDAAEWAISFSGWRILLSNGQSFNEIGFWGSGFNNANKCFSGDFNGDGLADACRYNNDGTWQVALSTGSSFNSLSTWISSFGSSKIPFSLDVNGDGLTDAVAFDSNTGRWQVAISDGTKFIPSDDWINNFGANEFPLAGDFSGNSIVGPGFFDSSSGNWQIAATQGTPNDLLTQINNGIGGSTIITYAPSPHNTNSPFILQTVQSVTINDGLGNSYATNYQFSGGSYDRQDKEFRGFNYAKVTDAEGNYTETYFHQDDIYKGRPYLQQFKDSSGNIYSKQESVWNYSEPNPGEYFIYLKQQNIFTYDGDATFKQARTDYEYDVYGNTRRTKSYGDVNVAGDEKDVYVEYVYNTAHWILSLPAHSYILDSQSNKAQEKWFYYDNHASLTDPPTKGSLTKEELWLNTGPQNPITTHAYDDYGNATSTTDAESHNSAIAYDSTYHIYPTTITNALSQNTQHTADPKTGQILTTTDVNSQTSTNVYDVLGRLVKVIGPNDTVDLPGTIYEYDLSACPIKITKKSKINTQGEYVIEYSFSDGLGRLIQTKLPAEDDPITHLARQTVSDIAKYDQRGQVKEKYFPYFVQESPGYSTPDYLSPKVTFSYDAIGRLTQVTNPDTTYSTINYSDWVITKTDENNHLKTEYYDAYERLIKVEEHNQGLTYTTTYEYDIQDNLTKVTDNQNNIIQIWYDSLGRKTKIDDPDLGVWLYEYDRVGKLTKQTDAKGSIINFQYDALNRLQTKNYPTGTDVTYIYDDTSKPNCIGRLCKVIDASGSTELFYDNLGREIKSIKIVSGASFTTERAYDFLDRVVSLKYPNGEIANYTYNKSGNVESISGASNYVTNINYSPTGQMTRIDFGNGTYTDYTYNPQTLRLSNLKTNDGALQDISYNFDNVGNVKDIIDRVNTGTQTFVYDDIDRLTNASGSYGSLNYRYDSIGDMIEKEGVSYTYGQTGKKPHAVTLGSNGFNAIYDENGNMTNKNNTVFTYDYDNRLTKVESGTLTNEIELSIDLRPGWNFISIPVIPSNTEIISVFSNLIFGADYDQVSRYNSQTAQFEHFVNNSTFDDFTTIEYGRGYQIFVTNPSGCTLTVRGCLPQQAENVSLFAGWNLVFSPYLVEKQVVDTLSPLVLGTDYNHVSRYNNLSQEFEHFRNVPEDTLHSMKPTEGYYLYCLNNTTWNVSSQKSITTFVYDAQGDRVKKMAGSETTIYIDSLYEKTGTRTTNHIFLGQNRIVSVESTGNAYYYHQDHLGSSNIVTDQAGNRVQLLEYTPFGTTWVNQGQDLAKFKFTGKELDKTGLYYFGARYYEPEIGRFIQPDSYVQDPSDPQSFNRYSYCRNNPLTYTDPSGNFWEFIFLALSYISMASAVVSAVSSIVAMATDSQTWANIAKISGIISIATGITAAVGNSISASIASKGTMTASASMNDVDLGVIRVTLKNAQIAQQAAEAARQAQVASIIGGINTALDFGGLIPGIGEPLDLINAGIYAIRGDFLNAGLSAASAIPFVGWTTSGAKIGMKGINAGKKFVIGETSKRVAKEALEIGAEHYVPRKAVSEIGLRKALRNNYQVLRRKFLQGYELIDKGLDPKRVGNRGIFYEAETRWRKLWGWGK